MPIDRTCYNPDCPYRDKKSSECGKGQIPSLCVDAWLSEDGVKKSFQYYATVFRSPSCFCGAWKREKTGFCYKCHNLLPTEQKFGLRRSLKTGEWGEAYEISKKYLIEEHGK